MSLEAPARRDLPVAEEGSPRRIRPRSARGLRRTFRPLTRRGRWRRTVAARVLSAVLAGAALWLTASALLPAPPDPGVPVLVVTRDLPLGATVGADDVRVDRRPDAYVPRGALTAGEAAVGRVLGAPMVSGEIVTATRFRGPGQLAALPAGSLAVSLPAGDPSIVSTLRPADLVSVLVTGSGETVATSAVVLATDLPSSGMLGGSGSTGAHVWLALTPAEARAVAVALGGSTPAGFLVAPHR
ncbi:MAG: SAF domain-containing protein [Actinomycetota bacterium]|nr:SAF domain-containing protein [Actinomycetota bacterium]